MIVPPYLSYKNKIDIINTINPLTWKTNQMYLFQFHLNCCWNYKNLRSYRILMVNRFQSILIW